MWKALFLLDWTKLQALRICDLINRWVIQIYYRSRLNDETQTWRQAHNFFESQQYLFFIDVI